MEEFYVFMLIGIILFIPSIIINSLSIMWINNKQARFERRIVKEILEILKNKKY